MDADDNENGSDGAKRAWEVVDLLRANAPEGWALDTVELSTTRSVHIRGTDWKIECSINVGSQRSEGAVYLHADCSGPLEQMIEIVAWLRSIEQILARNGYDGRLSLGDISGCLNGFFTKALSDADAVRREIVFLDRFDLRGST